MAKTETGLPKADRPARTRNSDLAQPVSARRTKFWQAAETLDRIENDHFDDLTQELGTLKSGLRVTPLGASSVTEPSSLDPDATLAEQLNYRLLMVEYRLSIVAAVLHAINDELW